MDLEDPRTFELFLEIYGTLPRAGPGSTADTLRALAMVPTPEIRSALDLGCGPGALDLTPSMADEIAAGATEEIDTFRRYSEFYSYAFFVVQPRKNG